MVLPFSTHCSRYIYMTDNSMKQSIQQSNHDSHQVEEKNLPTILPHRANLDRSIKRSINSTFVADTARLGQSSSSTEVESTPPAYPSNHHSFDDPISCGESITHPLGESFDEYVNQSYSFDEDDAINVSKMTDHDQSIDISEIEHELFLLASSQSLNESFDFVDSQSLTGFLDESIDQSNIQPTDESINQSNNQSIIQSAHRSQNGSPEDTRDSWISSGEMHISSLWSTSISSRDSEGYRSINQPTSQLLVENDDIAPVVDFDSNDSNDLTPNSQSFSQSTIDNCYDESEDDEECPIDQPDNRSRETRYNQSGHHANIS